MADLCLASGIHTRQNTYLSSLAGALMSHYLIIGNGDFLSPERLTFLLAPKPNIIALDGAIHRLLALGLTPDIHMGDFDSTDPLQLPHTSISWQTITAADQSKTDLQKAIEFADQMNASRIDLACVLGQRLDHLLTNIRACYTYHKPDRSLFLYTEREVATYVKDRKIKLTGEVGSHCAIMALPERAIISSGDLRYPCHNFELIYGKQESICNQLARTPASIDVQGGAMIISTHAIHAG